MRVTQSQFRAALLDPGQPVPPGLSDGRGLPAGRRFAVYRNNVAVSLTEALATGFPVIANLLGEENFTALMGIFLRRHPPASPLMMQYGADLPAFLAGFVPLQHLGYLPDVARLELAMRRAYHAADSAPIAPDTLQGMSPDRLLEARFALAPAVQILRSSWPLHAIWAYNMQNGPQPQTGAQDVLVTRPDYDPQIASLGEGAARFVEAMGAGENLGTAHDLALSEAADFDLSAILAQLLQGGALTPIPSEDNK